MDPKTFQLIFNLVQLIGAAVSMSPEISAKYKEHKGKLQQFINEGRDPTEEEHEELNNSIKNLLSNL